LQTLTTVKGRVLNELGRHREAVISFEICLRIEPNYPLFFSVYSLSLNFVGRFEDAISSSKKALALNRWDLVAPIQILEALMSLQKYDQVLEICKSITSSNKRDAASYYYMGSALRFLGSSLEAMQSYQVALRYDAKILNKDAKLWFNYQRASNLYHDGAFQECLQVLQLNFRLSPNHILSLDLKVKCMLQLNDFESLWKYGAQLKAHFDCSTQTDEFADSERKMIAKTLTRYSKLHKMRFGL
jgi:tetratricopeptide (TPR) repeat protein